MSMGYVKRTREELIALAADAEKQDAIDAAGPPTRGDLQRIEAILSEILVTLKDARDDAKAIAREARRSHLRVA